METQKRSNEFMRIANMVAFASKNIEKINEIFDVEDEEFDYLILELLELEEKITYLSDFEITSGYHWFDGEKQEALQIIEYGLDAALEAFEEIFDNASRELEETLEEVGFCKHNLVEYHDGRLEPCYVNPYNYARE